MVWEEYAEILDSKNLPFQLGIVRNRKYKLLDNHTILITLHGNLEHQHLTKLKGGLLPFLKEKLNNQFIEVNGEIKEFEQGERKPYTPQEKFEAAAKEHPVLLTLKDTFGLDMDSE